MDEIRLLNILTSPSQNVKQPGIADSNSTNLPPIITRFPPGSILAGFIINRDGSGNPILRTPENGDITFQSQLFLKIGAEVVIRVENRSGHPQAHILTIDGQPPEQAEKVSVINQPRDNVFTSAAPPQKPNVPAGDISTAPAARPASAVAVNTQPAITATVTSNIPALPQGTQLTLNVISAEAPPVSQPPGATPAPLAAAQPANPQYAAYARAAGTPTTPPPVGAAPVTASPASTAPTTEAQAPLTVGQNLQLNVTGSTQAGQTITQTPQGVTIQLNTTTPLAAGIRLKVEVSQVTQPVSTAAATLPDEPAPVATLARQWPSIQQIASLLSASAEAHPLSASGLTILTGLTNPPAAGTSGSGISPASISTGLMVFIAALRGGDFRGWLGLDNAKRLEDSGHTQLVKKAEGEFLSLARQFTEVQPGQWQSLFFPVAVHGEVQQARLFVKRDRKGQKNAADKSEEDTRFIVEVELSQMGEMQLDGFIRKDPKSMEFDLFVRTRRPLDEEAQQAIFAIYNDTGSLTGYKGSLVFQTVNEFPVHPVEEAISGHASDVKI